MKQHQISSTSQQHPHQDSSYTSGGAYNSNNNNNKQHRRQSRGGKYASIWALFGYKQAEDDSLPSNIESSKRLESSKGVDKST